MALPVDRFWQAYLGTALRPGIQVVPHASLAGYDGVWFFVHGDCTVVSAPSAWCEVLAEAVARTPIDALISEPGLRDIFGDAYDRSIGPSWLGWLPVDDFRPVTSERVRPATPAELETLRAASQPEAWEVADLHADGAFGWFDDTDAGETRIQAASSVTRWGEGVVGPGVLSLRPGYGKAVVSASCAAALQGDALVVYQTLRANERAVGLARALGFAFYASHVAVRLRTQQAGTRGSGR